MSRKQSAKMAQSLTDLPPNILIEILVRLPLKAVFVIRSVCKTLLSLATPDPHFIDLHSSNSAQILVFQFGNAYKPSHLLRLAEPELDISPRYVDNLVLKPLFQLPKMGTSFNFYRTYHQEENKFVLANSCNGLVFFVRRHAGDERSLVCNPVTNEYLIIPGIDEKIRLDSRTKSMWLGFSPGSNQYKVLRLFTSLNVDPVEVRAQVFVIGSDSWRDLEGVPLGSDHSWDLCSAFLSGLMYWLDQSWSGIIFFDFELEIFGDVAFPSEFTDEQLRNKHCMSIGVLGGCLCLGYNDFDAKHVEIWMMRKVCGDQESWNKEFVFDTVRPMGQPVLGRFKPLQFLRNGEILMLWIGNDLVCYDPKMNSLRYVGFNRLRLTPKAVALTPSFVPLKETLKVDEVLSRYVRPRKVMKRSYEKGRKITY
ncbi:hypothetical protein CASFOL_010570 [Castilleja foliolosa]|uniref:F-box domain-containing protein n=1 Tax=Castilleja foliolosa TaxID=1961234 RepID=A0ABD3DSZ4_9LAMI